MFATGVDCIDANELECISRGEDGCEWEGDAEVSMTNKEW